MTDFKSKTRKGLNWSSLKKDCMGCFEGARHSKKDIFKEA